MATRGSRSRDIAVHPRDTAVSSRVQGRVGPELGKPTRVEAHACSGRQTAHGRGVLCRRRVSESLAGNRSLLGPCLDHLGKPMKRALRFEKNYINSEDRARTAEAGRQGVSMTDGLALSEASAVGPERPGCV